MSLFYPVVVSKSSSFKTRPGDVLSSTPIQDVTRLSTDSEMDVTLQSEVSRASLALASPTPRSRGGSTPTADHSVIIRVHKACLWERIAAQRHMKPEDARKWFEIQRTRYGKLTVKKSGSGVTKPTPRQTWIENTFPFLDGHIRRKGVSKSSAFKTRAGEVLSSTSIQDLTRLSTYSEMDVTLQSEVSRAPRALASPGLAFLVCWGNI